MSCGSVFVRGRIPSAPFFICLDVRQGEPFSFDALERYLETLEAVQRSVSPGMRLAGILTGIQDARTAMGQFILEQARQQYEELVFDTVIRRKARIVEFSFEGVQNRTRMDREAIEQYERFVKELLNRVKSRSFP